MRLILHLTSTWLWKPFHFKPNFLLRKSPWKIIVQIPCELVWSARLGKGGLFFGSKDPSWSYIHSSCEGCLRCTLHTCTHQNIPIVDWAQHESMLIKQPWSPSEHAKVWNVMSIVFFLRRHWYTHFKLVARLSAILWYFHSHSHRGPQHIPARRAIVFSDQFV